MPNPLATVREKVSVAGTDAPVAVALTSSNATTSGLGDPPAL